MEKVTFRDYSFERPYIDKMTRKDTWVRFDYDNLYPQRVLELVNSSPLQKSILESKKTFIFGAGLEPTEENVYTPNMYETWDELMEKCLNDLVYLNAMSVQCILNESGNRWFFYHQPVEQVRFQNYNEHNFIEKAYLCTDWRKAQRNRNVVEIPMFGSETPRKGQAYLMYFAPNQVGEYYYSIPNFMCAANYIMADAALSQYYNNYIHNNFSANLAIRFPVEPPEEKKQELYDNLVSNFGGQKNAGNILCLFGESGVVPEINAIESVNADLYNSVVDIIKLALVSANRLTSPILAGISTSSGFSSKSDEMIAAYALYKLTVISSERSVLLKFFNKMLEMNGHGRVFKLLDFDLRKEFEGETVQNDSVEDKGNNVDQIDENNEQEEKEVTDGTDE